MTVLFGVIGFLFAGFAPGYLAIVCFRIKQHVPPIAGPFALSLILTNLAIEALTFAGAYTSSVMRPLAAITVVAALVVFLFEQRLSSGFFARAVGRRLQAWLEDARRQGLVILGVIAGLLAVAIIIQTIGMLLASMGSILVGYDPVIQWNRWAVDWSHNHYPDRIYHYPQLIPIAWSVPYVLMGTDAIQFFSGSFKMVFWLAIFETLAFIAVRLRNPILLLSLPLTYLLFTRVVGGTAFEDYLDVPVAFFALLSIAVALPPPTGRDRRRIMMLAIIFAAGAAMTKQVGVYMLAAAPGLLLVWDYEEHRSFARAIPTALDLSWRTAMGILLAAPIYIYAVITIQQGTNVSELSYLFEEIHGGKDRITRALLVLQGIASPRQLFAAVVFLILSCLAVRDRVFRWILILICIPFSVLWATNFSYDSRNLALALPFWALCAAAGAAFFDDATLLNAWTWLNSQPSTRGSDRFTKFQPIAALLISGFVIAATAIAWRYPGPKLLERQKALELRLLGDSPALTATMMSLVKSFGESYMVISEWQWACAFFFRQYPSVQCRRMAADQLFSPPGSSLLNDTSEDSLLILAKDSVKPARLLSLKAHGYEPTAETSENRDDPNATIYLFLVRPRRTS